MDFGYNDTPVISTFSSDPDGVYTVDSRNNDTICQDQDRRYYGNVVITGTSFIYMVIFKFSIKF